MMGIQLWEVREHRRTLTGGGGMLKTLVLENFRSLKKAKNVLQTDKQILVFPKAQGHNTRERG